MSKDKIVIGSNPIEEDLIVPSKSEFKELIKACRKRDIPTFRRLMDDDECGNKEIKMIMIAATIINAILIASKYLFLRGLIVELLYLLPSDTEKDEDGYENNNIRESVCWVLYTYYNSQFNDYIELGYEEETEDAKS